MTDYIIIFTFLERMRKQNSPYPIPPGAIILDHVSRKPSGQPIGLEGGVIMFTLIVGAISAGATLGGMVGSAVATVAGTSVATGTAVGTIAGAGIGLAAGVAEAGDALMERC